MTIEKKRLFASTGLTFIIWSIGSSVILFSIAIIFLRGQVRPILNLANAARQIGFGRDVKNYNIEGATEVRLAGRAFQAMSCLLYTSPSPRDPVSSRMPSSA